MPHQHKIAAAILVSLALTACPYPQSTARVPTLLPRIYPDGSGVLEISDALEARQQV